MSPEVRLLAKNSTAGACSQEHSKPVSKCGRARSAPPIPMLSEATWCFHHRDTILGDGLRHWPRVTCRSAAESRQDKATAEMACSVLNCARTERPPLRQRSPGQFSSQTVTSAPRNYIAANLHVRGVCDIDQNLQRGLGLRRSSVVENDHKFSEERELALKRSLSSLSLREGRPELPEFLRELSCTGIECRRLASVDMSQSASPKTFCPADTSSAIKAFNVFPNRRLTPVLSHPRQVKHDRSASHIRPCSVWLGPLSNLNINTQRLVLAYSSTAQLPKPSGSRVEISFESSSSECFTPLDCMSVGIACSTIDEDESEYQANDCSQRIVIPKLAMHRLAAEPKHNGASSSSLSTVGSTECSSVDEFSD